jgi:hypothetical protein
MKTIVGAVSEHGGGKNLKRRKGNTGQAINLQAKKKLQQ